MGLRRTTKAKARNIVWNNTQTMKPNIIFIHILKCGGTSLRHMLLDEYGYDAIAPVPLGGATGDFAYPHLHGVFPLQHQSTITPKAVKDYQVVMSHYDIQIASRLPEWHIMTMLRHPVEQLYSLFRFMKRNPDLKKMHSDIQHMGFEEWVCSNAAKPYFNTQTKYLSSHNQPTVHIAISWLLHGRLIYGILERFDESIALFNESFGWAMNSQHLNKAPSRTALSQDTMRMAEEYQRDDMELYRIACELFDTQFKDDPCVQ